MQGDNIKLHVPSEELGTLVSSTLASWHIALNPSLKPPKGDDFDLEIQGILLAAECNARHQDKEKSALSNKTIWEGYRFIDTPSEFLSLAAMLQIPICQSCAFYFPRDHFIRLQDGSVKTTYHSPSLDEAIRRTRSKSLYFGACQTAHTSNQLFNAWGGYAAQHKLNNEDLALFNGVTQFQYSYIEGGNLFTVTNEKGDLECYLGEDNFFHTLLSLELEERDWHELSVVSTSCSFEEQIERCHVLISDHKRSINNLNRSSDNNTSLFSKIEVSELLEEMFAIALLLQNGKHGLIDQQDQLNLLLIRFIAEGKSHSKTTFRQLAEIARIIDRFDPSVGGLSHENPSYAAACYLAKKFIVHSLIAKDLKIAPNALHLVPQIGYHLDSFLTPAPGNAFFITSYAYLSQLLDVVAASATTLNLSDVEMEQLTCYQKTAHKLDSELSPLLAELQRTLEAKGKKVIPMPQHVVFEPENLYQTFPMPDQTPTTYFGNAVSGFSKSINAPFYIAHGLSTRNRLGTILMDLFALALLSYEPKTHIYFVAYSNFDSSNICEATDSWCRIDTQSGIHCATFPLLRNEIDNAK